MTSTTKQTKQPDPDPFDFVWDRHRAATARHRGSVDINGDREPVHDDLMDDDLMDDDLMDDDYHSLPCGDIWRSFAAAAADFEDRGDGGHPGLAGRFLPVVPGLDEEGEGNRHAWTLTSFHDDFYQDAHDNDGLTVDPYFSAHGLGSPSFGSPESGWFDHDSFDMSAFDDMPAWDDSPSSSPVSSSAGNYFVDAALLHCPKRHIDRMGYRHRTFDADSNCCHLDSQERIHQFFDHVRDCSRMSQQTAKMTALFDALRFADHRLRPDLLCDDNPFDQDPAADELRMTGAMIALAELAATAATDLLLLATAFEAMSNLCCGVQGSSLEGSSKNLAPARLRDGVRERPTGGCPNWRLPLTLAMAA